MIVLSFLISLGCLVSILSIYVYPALLLASIRLLSLVHNSYVPTGNFSVPFMVDLPFEVPSKSLL